MTVGMSRVRGPHARFCEKDKGPVVTGPLPYSMMGRGMKPKLKVAPSLKTRSRSWRRKLGAG